MTPPVSPDFRVRGGTITIAMVRTDVDYDPIRNTPAFKRLLQRYANVHY